METIHVDGKCIPGQTADSRSPDLRLVNYRKAARRRGEVASAGGNDSGGAAAPCSSAEQSRLTRVAAALGRWARCRRPLGRSPSDGGCACGVRCLPGGGSTHGLLRRRAGLACAPRPRSSAGRAGVARGTWVPGHMTGDGAGKRQWLGAIQAASTRAAAASGGSAQRVGLSAIEWVGRLYHLGCLRTLAGTMDIFLIQQTCMWSSAKCV
uniref:Uncharacterized protein n=1 Tax=Setaria italica TaxID=4555 RepID=K3ZWX9_SETIT